MGQKVIIRFWW